MRVNHMLSRRDFLRLAAVSAAGATLAACAVPAPQAPQAPQATTQPAATSAATTAAATTAATTAPAATSGTVKWAEFYSLLQDVNGKLNQDWIKGVVTQFQDANPGWKVEQESIK